MTEKVLADARHYRDAIFAVDPGACNLSGLARSLPDMYDAIAAEVGYVDVPVRWAINRLNEAVTRAWKKDNAGTSSVNTDNAVEMYVRRLLRMAYDVWEEDDYETARHPIMRLMLDQMRQLAGVEYPPIDNYHELWSEAYDICGKRNA